MLGPRANFKLDKPWVPSFVRTRAEREVLHGHMRVATAMVLLVARLAYSAELQLLGSNSKLTFPDSNAVISAHCLDETAHVSLASPRKLETYETNNNNICLTMNHVPPTCLDTPKKTPCGRLLSPAPVTPGTLTPH